MKIKDIAIPALAVIAAVSALLPVKKLQNDGGTVVYEPITGLYRVENLHRINDSDPDKYITGQAVYFFGIEVYNNTRHDLTKDGGEYGRHRNN